MRILMLAPELLPVRGGASTYSLEIARNLPSEDEIEVIVPTHECPSEEYLKRIMIPDNVTIHHLGGKSGFPRSNRLVHLEYANAVKKHLADSRYDVIHSQSEMPDFLISPSSIPVPIVTTVHSTVETHFKVLRDYEIGLDSLSNKERFVRTMGPILKILEDRYYASERRFISVSHWGKDELLKEKRIPEQNVTVIHNGVNVDEFTPQRASEAERVFPTIAETDKTIILYMARFATRKGIHVLMETIPMVTSDVDVHFVIAGSGMDVSKYQKMENCTFLGQVQYSDAPHLYALSDIFVLPSLSENFPISLLEAMASECAIVASNICGIPEAITDTNNGILVPPNDPRAITEAIIRLSQDCNLRRDMGRKARKTAIDKYQWKRTAEMTHEYFESVASTRAR